MNLTNSELIKMLKVFEAKKIINMYANRKINLSAKQRDDLLDIRDNKKEIKYGKIIKIEVKKCTK